MLEIPPLPHRKVNVAVLAGALSVILVWALNKYVHADITTEIGQSITVVMSFVAAYLVPKGDQE